MPYFVVINEGAPDVRGNEAIISAGTGLGEAGLQFAGQVVRLRQVLFGHLRQVQAKLRGNVGDVPE